MGIDLVFGITYIYNLTKFTFFHKAQSRNMSKVDHQALPYVTYNRLF